MDSTVAPPQDTEPTVPPMDTTPPHGATIGGFPVWAIVLISVGGGLLIIGVIIAILLCYFARQRRLDTERRLEAARQAELNRAEELVDTLKAANRSRLQKGPCGHSFTPPPTASGQVQYALCPVCFPQPQASHASIVVAPPSQPLVMFQQSTQQTPSNQFEIQLQNMPQPIQQQLHPQMIQPQQIPPAAPPRSHLRLANSPNELPNSPAPTAPPGFVTVPMVYERY